MSDPTRDQPERADVLATRGPGYGQYQLGAESWRRTLRWLAAVTGQDPEQTEAPPKLYFRSDVLPAVLLGNAEQSPFRQNGTGVQCAVRVAAPATLGYLRFGLPWTFPNYVWVLDWIDVGSITTASEFVVHLNNLTAALVPGGEGIWLTESFVGNPTVFEFGTKGGPFVSESGGSPPAITGANFDQVGATIATVRKAYGDVVLPPGVIVLVAGNTAGGITVDITIHGRLFDMGTAIGRKV